LLDWIDGKLSPSEQAKLEQASGRAGLSERIAQMQAQRLILRSLPEEEAPVDLLDRVLNTLERDQLVGGEMPRHVDDVIIGRRVRSRFAGLAVAAGVTLLLGGGVYLASVALRPATPAVPGPIAMNTTPPLLPAERAQAKQSELAQAGTMQKSEADAAPAAGSDVEGLRSPPRGAMAKGAAPTPPALSDSAIASEVAISEPATPELTPLVSPERAATLANEGRLVIRVMASDTRGLSNIELAGKTNTKWRLRKDVPAAVAAAVLPTGPKADSGPDDSSLGLAMASADTRREAAAAVLSPYVGLRPNFDWTPPNPNDPLTKVRGTYLLEIPAEVGSLQSLKKLFADRLHAGVVFEELPPALAVAPPSTPDTVMWWTMGPDHWSPRASVPVVVEQR
jgi:hypothetical protein